jgi:hypothetical protein
MHFLCLPLHFWSGGGEHSCKLPARKYLVTKRACIACGQAGIYYHVRVGVWKMKLEKKAKV